jgi:hypothetical protein
MNLIRAQNGIQSMRYHAKPAACKTIAACGICSLSSLELIGSIPAAAAIPAAATEQNEDKDYDEQSVGVHVRLPGVRARRVVTQGGLFDSIDR